MRRIITSLFVTVAIIVISGPLTVAQEVLHQFNEGYISSVRAKYGREAVLQDTLLYMIANEDLNISGTTGIKELVDLSGKLKWSEIAADDKGTFRGRGLRGGYLLCEYNARKSENVVLEISGHNEVYVNGSPRGGDVYNYGWVQHPVKLKRGLNIFLIRGSRGQVSASLVRPAAKMFLSERDVLLPDIIKGDGEPVLGAVRLINSSDNPLESFWLVSRVNGVRNAGYQVPVVGEMTSRKIPFVIDPKLMDSDGEIVLTFELTGPQGKVIDTGASPEFKIGIKEKQDKRKETFISGIDGSVQYYSVVPQKGGNNDNPALFFSLHGASVEATNQAGAYSHKDWGLLVAPTNRRPYGFDWEDWGRLDAREVLENVIKKYSPDPNRTYLTGHSMGGHGTWQFGVTYPDYWAAIAPSAGWYSFWSYAGKEEQEGKDPMAAYFSLASNPSNTLELSDNYLHYGIYVLHGDKDDNVPVSQARFMRSHLAEFHPDFCYYERPGAGHWWGNECVDWPPLFRFFEDHKRPELNEIKNIDFSTACPGVSSTSRFATIWQQEKNLEISNIRIKQDTDKKEIRVDTRNVGLIKLDLNHLQSGQPYDIICESDSFKLDPGTLPEAYFKKTPEGWMIAEEPGEHEKGPRRYGMFKEAFQNNMLFVYGTGGTKEENVWARDKARFDAETFWYRGNGAIDVLSDKDYLESGINNRNIILFGHSEMNLAWKKLLASAPVQINRGEVILGDKKIPGPDLAAYFIYPVPGEEKTSVGVVAGTGMPGMKAAIPNRYFVSGAGFPDFMIFRSQMLESGIDGVVAAGFFNTRWQLDPQEYEVIDN